jgi:hypothetical protein
MGESRASVAMMKKVVEMEEEGTQGRAEEECCLNRRKSGSSRDLVEGRKHKVERKRSAESFELLSHNTTTPSPLSSILNEYFQIIFSHK